MQEKLEKVGFLLSYHFSNGGKIDHFAKKNAKLETPYSILPTAMPRNL